MPKNKTDISETDRIIQLLRQKYSDKNQWASFVELRCGTGFVQYKRGGSSRQALDFFAMNLYPSKGFRSLAFEIKVSRSDFLNEIKKPEKRAFAESVAGECYFVVPHGLVEKDEVPEGWGLMYAQSSRIIRKKHATQREVEDWPMPFVAAIARRNNDKPVKPFVAKYHGEELSDEELIELAERKIDKHYNDKKSKIKREGVTEFKEKNEYKKHIQLYEAVEEVIGYMGWDPARKFTEWYEENFGQALPKDLRRTLKNAKIKIENVLKVANQQTVLSGEKNNG